MTNDFEVITVKDITPESLVIVKYIYMCSELSNWLCDIPQSNFSLLNCR